MAAIVGASAALDLHEFGHAKQLQLLMLLDGGRQSVVIALTSISGRTCLHVDAELGRLGPVHREVMLSFSLSAAVVADGAVAVLRPADVHVQVVVV